jgi:DNA circularisation protein N-terminus
MTDIFRQLPRLQWRGKEYPVRERTVGFQLDLARHTYVFRDNELVDSLGTRNWTFDYTIPFREDLAAGPWFKMYELEFGPFLDACRDRSVGELLDPMLGPFDAKCMSVSIATDINARDGEDVNVTFVHSPEPDAEDVAFKDLGGIQGAALDGKRLGEDIARISDQQLTDAGLLDNDIPPDLGVDALDQISGLGAQAVAQAGRVDAAFQRTAGKLEKIEGTLDKVNEDAGNLTQAPVIRGARRLRDSSGRLSAKAIFPGRQILTVTVQNDTTIGVLASDLGVGQVELLLLNPGLPLPLVEGGSVISYPA